MKLSEFFKGMIVLVSWSDDRKTGRERERLSFGLIKFGKSTVWIRISVPSSSSCPSVIWSCNKHYHYIKKILIAPSFTYSKGFMISPPYPEIRGANYLHQLWETLYDVQKKWMRGGSRARRLLCSVWNYINQNYQHCQQSKINNKHVHVGQGIRKQLTALLTCRVRDSWAGVDGPSWVQHWPIHYPRKKSQLLP